MNRAERRRQARAMAKDAPSRKAIEQLLKEGRKPTERRVRERVVREEKGRQISVTESGLTIVRRSVR